MGGINDISFGSMTLAYGGTGTVGTGQSPATQPPTAQVDQPSANFQSTTLTAEEKATNRAIAKAVCATKPTTQKDANAAMAPYQAQIDKMSEPAKADLRSELKLEGQRVGSTDKGFLEKYLPLIMLAAEVACSGIGKYNASLWNKAGQVIPALMTQKESTIDWVGEVK